MNYSKLHQQVAKLTGGDGIIMSDYQPSVTDTWIDTGSYILNAQISGSILKGAPGNKMISIAGKPKTGKSYIVYSIMREAQKMGYFILFYETEGSVVDKERLINHGVDLNMAKLYTPDTIDEINTDMTKLTDNLMGMKSKSNKNLPKFMLVIDSVKALSSSKEYDDSRKGKNKADMGTSAKDVGKFFKMHCSRLERLGIPIIVTGHTYGQQDMYGNRKEVPSLNGNGAIYLSSCVLMLTKKEDKDKKAKESKTGVLTRLKKGLIIKSEVVESRYSKHIPIKLYISFAKGMNRFLGLENFTSWDVCGIDTGKWVDFVDVVEELIKKKVLDQTKLADTMITVKMLKDNLAKSKFADIEAHIDKMVEDGFLVLEAPGEWTITKKINKMVKDDEYIGYEEDGLLVGSVNPNSPQVIVKHIPGAKFKKTEIFNETVFNRDVLEKLDPIINRYFALGKEDGDIISSEDSDIIEQTKMEIDDLLN